MNKQEDVNQDFQLREQYIQYVWGPGKKPGDCAGGYTCESSGELSSWWGGVRGDFLSYNLRNILNFIPYN